MNLAVQYKQNMDQDSEAIQHARHVFDLEIEALRCVRGQLNGSFHQAIERMRETIDAGRKLIVTGVGKSGHIAGKIAATLTSTGSPSVFMNPTDALHGDMGLVSPHDLVLILSYSGKTQEILRLIPNLKRLKTELIVITSDSSSPLALQADLHLNVRVPREACPLNLAPTASTTAMLALGDALAMVLLKERGFSEEDFARYHPEGALGRNLLVRIEKIMRPLDRVAVCTKTTCVSDALAEISRKRCGAVIVVDEQGALAGIYTHGDFARGYQKDRNVGELALERVLTPKPVSIRAGKLAVEALNLFEKYPIQDLIVMDTDNKPIGLVDIQDLPKAGVM